MIKLTDLLQEQDSFTAINKSSGNVTAFKSKDARDSAVKSGTHDKNKDSEDDDDKKDTPKVNIFKRDNDSDSKKNLQKMKKDKSGTQKSLFPDEKPDSKPTGDSNKIKDPKGMSKVVPKDIGTDPDKMEAWLFDEDGAIGDGQSFGMSDKNADELYNLHGKYDDAKKAGDKKEIERTKKEYIEFVYNNLEKNQNKPKEPETNDYWNKDKDAPKRDDNTDTQIDDVQNNIGDLDGDEIRDYAESDIFPYLKGKDLEIAKSLVDDIEDSGSDFVRSADVRADLKDLFDKKMTLDSPKIKPFAPKPSKIVLKNLDTLGDMAIGDKPALNPKDMGDAEYERTMLRMIHNSLEDSNYHTANRFIFADLEGNKEKRKKADFRNAPDLGSPDYKDWTEKNTIYTKDFNAGFNRKNERDDLFDKVSIEAAQKSGHDGGQILAGYLVKLRKDGKEDLANRIQKSFEDAEKSMDEGKLSITSLVKESIFIKNLINEGTRSQVGVIGRNGKIVSAYVHFDGYPSNMKPGLKHHMKNEKDVLKLIKMGGARGIFDDKEIEYYKKSGQPLKGDSKDIKSYINDAGVEAGAEYVYLYNIKDKKWYFADVYGKKELKKLF
jgi:hypothetical protein